MKTIETTVYEFAELSDSAKEKARDWYRQGALDHEWWDSTYEDAANVGLKIKSFDLDRNRHATGELTEPATTVAEAIVADHGATCETHKTAKQFLADWWTTANSDEDKREDLEAEFLKSLLEDYSNMLQHEYEYLLSDEVVDESIKTNGYTFTESGKRF